MSTPAPSSLRADAPHNSLRTDVSPNSQGADAPLPSPRPEVALSSLEPPAPPTPAIITADKKGKRPRHQKGQPKAKPGKLSWLHGTKKVFFASRKEDWLREAEAGRSGPFYLKISKLYVKKYGLTMADDQDLEFDVADPPDSAMDKVVHEALSPEEQAVRREYMKTLRTRIGNWYRGEYGSLLKSDKVAFKELFTGALDGAPAKPLWRGRMAETWKHGVGDFTLRPKGA
ncbi:hypothetical protein B0H14DRAFT_3895775 [Mycena olivaceomarginata]|nr:hypothetical protein B0H14DRAFT_3895775 [Mycena olivaceomarginata]